MLAFYKMVFQLAENGAYVYPDGNSYNNNNNNNRAVPAGSSKFNKTRAFN